MSRLHSRIAGQAGAARAAAASYHPHGTPDTPMTMPMTRVVFGGGGAQVEQMTGLVTANGAVIPATVPGQYGQVYLTPMPGRMPSPAMWH
jgi:hypothetical protein